MDTSDSKKLITAITSADSAGVAAGFVQGITQVANNLRSQAEAWRRDLDEQRGTVRWWMVFVPWRILRRRIDRICAEAAAEVLESLAGKLVEQAQAHALESARRKVEAERTAREAIDALSLQRSRPTLRTRLRNLLGGAA